MSDNTDTNTPTVLVKVTGSPMREISAANLGDLREQLGLDGYAAMVNGEPVEDPSSAFEGGEFVTFAAAVKAG